MDARETICDETDTMVAYIPRGCPYGDALVSTGGFYAAVTPENIAAAWKASAEQAWRPVLRVVSYDDGVSNGHDGWESAIKGRPALHWGWERV